MSQNIQGISGKNLYDAAAKGDTALLHELLENDPLLLDKISYTSPDKTPLHVATIKGHLDFVKEVLRLNPQLAEELDSQRSSALHIALARGWSEIAKELLLVVPEMCLARDSQGRNPVHIAVIKGHVQIIEDLILNVTVAAREKIDRGLTVLHLCVKHDKLEAMKILVSNLTDLINAKDDDGETILHMAARNKKIEIINYLIEVPDIDKYGKNSRGETAWDLCLLNGLTDSVNVVLKPLQSNSNPQTQKSVEWLRKKRDAIMVVAILIASMAFQAAVNPPGGVWKDEYMKESKGDAVLHPHRAGESVMSYHHSNVYRGFINANTIAFILSLSTILLLISGLPYRRRLYMWILTVIMWGTLASIAVTYAISITVVTPKTFRKPLTRLMVVSFMIWCVVMSILFAGNTARLIDRWLKKKGIVWRPMRLTSSPGQGEHVDA